MNQARICLTYVEVGDKGFGFVDIEKFEFYDLKYDPEKSQELQARYEGVIPSWHINKKYWISVYFNKGVPDNVVLELVKDSYKLVFDKILQKTKAEIETE